MNAPFKLFKGIEQISNKVNSLHRRKRRPQLDEKSFGKEKPFKDIFNRSPCSLIKIVYTAQATIRITALSK